MKESEKRGGDKSFYDWSFWEHWLPLLLSQKVNLFYDSVYFDDYCYLVSASQMKFSTLDFFPDLCAFLFLWPVPFLHNRV